MSSVEEFEKEMAPYDEQADQVETRKTLPDGWTGQARIAVARVEHPSWDGGEDKWQIFWIFEALDGSGSAAQWDSLDVDFAGFGITKARLDKLGYTGKLSGVARACADGFFEDLVVEGRVKHTPKRDHPGEVFVNFYVNKVHGKMTEDQRTAVATPADDDLPF